jgi:hypothetical protein
MFVRFSSQENINDFVATATNTAGGQRLTDGNEIVSALRSRGQILIWTDTSIHGQQFLDRPTPLASSSWVPTAESSRPTRQLT